MIAPAGVIDPWAIVREAIRAYKQDPWVGPMMALAILETAHNQNSPRLRFPTPREKEQLMGLHVFTQEIEASFVGFPIEGQILSRHEGQDEEGDHSSVTVAIGTDEERDDGAMGSWVRIDADAARLARVFRDLADRIDPSSGGTE